MLPVTLTVSPDLGSSVFTFDFEHECDAHYEVPVMWPILSSLPPASLPRVITSLCLLRGWPALLWPEPAYLNSFQRNKAQQCTERQVLGRTAWYKWMYPDLCHVCSGKKKTKPRLSKGSIYSSCKTELLSVAAVVSLFCAMVQIKPVLLSLTAETELRTGRT